MKKSLPVWIFILVCITSCHKNISFKDGIITEEFIYDTASFPSCHAATIAETPEGLIAAWFGGTHERNPDVCIYVSKKTNGKWSEPMMAADGVQSDTFRLPTWNPVLYQISDGDLLLFYKVGPHPSSWWGMLKRSSDHGKTWGPAEQLPAGFIGPVKNKPVLLGNGNLILPSSTEHSGWKIHMEMTPDFGKTWKMHEPVNDAKTYEAIQPSVLIHKNGDLQLLGRSRNAVLVTSWSKDNGETWSLLRPSGLPNNQSGTDAVTLADGRQLVVYNHLKTPINAKKGYRTPLNVAITDDGKKWFAALILEDSEIGQYSYPAVIQSADGMVHIVYTWRRDKIKYVKVDPGKIKTLEIIDEKWPLIPQNLN